MAKFLFSDEVSALSPVLMTVCLTFALERRNSVLDLSLYLVCVYVYVPSCVHAGARARVYVCMCTRACAWAREHAYVHLCVCVCLCVSLSVRLSLCLCLCMRVSVRVRARMHLSAYMSTDINECNQQNGGCLHSCTNTKGSFVCTCTPGYQLGVDGKSCYSEYPPTHPIPTPHSIPHPHPSVPCRLHSHLPELMTKVVCVCPLGRSSALLRNSAHAAVCLCYSFEPFWTRVLSFQNNTFQRKTDRE